MKWDGGRMKSEGEWEWLKKDEEKDEEERESENDWRTEKKRMMRRGGVKMIEEKWRKGWRGEGEWEWEWLKNGEEKDEEERESENYRRFVSVYPNTDTIMYWSELGVVSLYYNLTA